MLVEENPSSRAAFTSERFDVIVIGGGISGVAIARACAQGHLRTLLLEKNDFGSGTSSRSTRLIHGGLRYLEHGDLTLVRESLRERERLKMEQPHLVRPAQFILAFPKEKRWLTTRNPLALRAGLWIYGQLGGKSTSALTPKMKDALLAEHESWQIFDYEDAQCEFPERLIAEWLVEAVGAGAMARNHTDVLEVETATGRVTGVLTRDRFTGNENRYQATHIVNATGPWADQVCSASRIDCDRMVGGVRGSHIVLPQFSGGPSCAVFTEAVDGRPFFIIPWNKQLLVGTTEVPDESDPSTVQANGVEIDYLFQSFGKLFPASGLVKEDIQYSYSGVRPLPFSQSKDLGGISRQYVLHDHSDDGARGLLSVIGGKLTTAASLGRHCARKLGARVDEPGTMIVAKGPANGYASTLEQWSKQVAESTRNCRGVVAQESARAVAEWHGRGALSIIRRASQQELLAERLCPHSPHLLAEAVHAVEMEHAVTLGDILLRRTPVAWSACWNDECSRFAAARIGQALGWSAKRVAVEMDAFDEERRNLLQDVKSLNCGSVGPGAQKDVAQHTGIV